MSDNGKFDSADSISNPTAASPATVSGYASSESITREFVIRSILDFAEAGNGSVHQFSETAQHVYLTSGEAFSMNESGVSRFR